VRSYRQGHDTSRRPGPAEARRLHQIIALRGFGLPLAEIARLLEGGRIRCGCCGGSWRRPKSGSRRRSGCGTRYWR
jgi:hypothetical protein